MDLDLVMEKGLFNSYIVLLLRRHNIKTIENFFGTHFTKLARICSVPFTTIWRMKKQLYDEFAPTIVKNIPNIDELENMYPLIITGIESLDELLGLAGDTNELIMELCGSAGIGKSLLCQTLCINFCLSHMNESHVLYIDTKNDFNASFIVTKMKQEWDYELYDISYVIETILIERAYSMRAVIHILESIESTQKIRLIIIDSLSALWYSHSERTFFNANYWLTKLCQTVHKLNRTQGISFVLVNLTFQQQQQKQQPLRTAMGRFWKKFPQIRLCMKLPQQQQQKHPNCMRVISLEKCPYNKTDIECLVQINENGIVI